MRLGGLTVTLQARLPDEAGEGGELALQAVQVHPTVVQGVLCSLEHPQQAENLQVGLHGGVVQHCGYWLLNIVLQNEHVPACASLAVRVWGFAQSSRSCFQPHIAIPFCTF